MTIALPLLLALAAWSGPDEQATQFGSMTLILQEWKRDPGALPVLDTPGIRPQFQLRWKAPAGDMTVELTDDGQFLGYSIAGYNCTSMAVRLRYSRTVGEAALWQTLTRGLRDHARSCRKVPAADQAAYRSAFAGAQDDFVAGVEALKKRAARRFGPELARCGPVKQPFIRSDYDAPCNYKW